MMVRDWMSTPVMTVQPETPFLGALRLMRRHGYRRLPVVDRSNRLAGIVSVCDLLRAAPPAGSSLSLLEITDLLDDLTIQQVMTRSIIIATPETSVVDAAGLMVANRVGGLPVVESTGARSRVVGIITQGDLMPVFARLLAGQPASQVNGRTRPSQLPPSLGAIAA